MTSERSAGSQDSEPDDGTAAGRLTRALRISAAAAEVRRQEHLALLEAIVSTAARVIEAAAGSLMLLDRRTNELVFQVATGPGAEAIKQFRVPVGEGIAGFTAATGQALAIADTSRDPRHARQIAEGSGYVPKNLLCVPLLLRGELIGVMELLDKRGGTTPFTPQDTAVLGSFGEQAALAIDLSLHAQSLERLLIGAAQGEQETRVIADVARFVEETIADPAYERTLTLARQIAAIAGAGERQVQLCGAILSAVEQFALRSPAAEAQSAMDDVFGGTVFGVSPAGGNQ